MKNDTKVIDEIVKNIEEVACYMTPAKASVEVGKIIDRSFYVIPQHIMPKVTFGFIGDGGTPRLTHINENASNGDTSIMREIAYEYLVMADFLDSKVDEEEALKLRKARWDAYSTIYPYQNMHEFESFDYMTHTQVNIQRSIDVIVALKRQLDNK